MPFTIKFSSAYWSDREPYEKTINTLDDLAELQAFYHHPLIVDFYAHTIEVYDDWRE